MEYLSNQEYNHIVRIVGNDIPGERKLIVGLTQIKGIGFNFATAISSTLKINQNSNIGHLTEENVKAIEKLCKISPPKINIHITTVWVDRCVIMVRDIVRVIALLTTSVTIIPGGGLLLNFFLK